MAAVTHTLAASAIDKHLRPFDPGRDLAAVADLVELCFAETLDPDGRDYLAQMRSASRGSTLQRAAQGWTNPALGGFVWVEEGAIVGNVSLIPHFYKTRRLYLIANVAVHPTLRRRGIARILTEKAIQYAREHLAPAVWLHVREENQAALNLYQSEGFIQRAVRTTWLGLPDSTPVEAPPGTRFVPLDRRSWHPVRDWLRRSYPAEVTWYLPFRIENMQPGLLGSVFRFLNGANLRQWAILQERRMVAAATLQAAAGHANLIWLAAPEQQNSEAVRALLEYARHHSPVRRNLALDYPAQIYEDAIRAAGFNIQQTLVWMTKPLS